MDAANKPASRIVPLSKKSLERVFNWADSVRGNKLADAYLYACSVIGDAEEAGSNLLGMWGDEWDDCRFLYRYASTTSSAGYDLRDAIGRVILERLNKEERLKPKLSVVRK